MSTASISYLALDSSYDPDFNPQNALTGVEAVAQSILTRLKLWYGEWWENLKLGLPVLQSIVGQLGSPQGLDTMSLLIQTQIQQTPYVISVGSVQVTFVNGLLSYKSTAQTQFGSVTVSNQLGQNAGL